MFLSVIVPIYNVENLLKECVESILAQTFSDYEVILVDDGSTDNSGHICDDYAKSDNRIKVIHKKNGGQSTARNRGVEIAQGRYLFFIDSDDVISDKTAFQQLKEKSVSDPDIIAYRYNKWFSDRITDMNITFKEISGTTKNDIIFGLVKNDCFYCSCWSKVTKNSLIKDNNIIFDECSKCEDMDWYFNVVQVAETIELIDKPFINYRQREGSVTKLSGEKGFTDNIMVINKWIAIFENCTDESWKNTMLCALSKLYCNLLISFSANYKKLKKYSAEVYKNKRLLYYHSNPRANVLYRVSKIAGIKLTCQLLRIASALR